MKEIIEASLKDFEKVKQIECRKAAFTKKHYFYDFATKRRVLLYIPNNW